MKKTLWENIQYFKDTLNAIKISLLMIVVVYITLNNLTTELFGKYLTFLFPLITTFVASTTYIGEALRIGLVLLYSFFCIIVLQAIFFAINANYSSGVVDILVVFEIFLSTFIIALFDFPLKNFILGMNALFILGPEGFSDVSVLNYAWWMLRIVIGIAAGLAITLIPYPRTASIAYSSYVREAFSALSKNQSILSLISWNQHTTDIGSLDSFRNIKPGNGNIRMRLILASSKNQEVLFDKLLKNKLHPIYHATKWDRYSYEGHSSVAKMVLYQGVKIKHYLRSAHVSLKKIASSSEILHYRNFFFDDVYWEVFNLSNSVQTIIEEITSPYGLREYRNLCCSFENAKGFENHLIALEQAKNNLDFLIKETEKRIMEQLASWFESQDNQTQKLAPFHFTAYLL